MKIEEQEMKKLDEFLIKNRPMPPRPKPDEFNSIIQKVAKSDTIKEPSSPSYLWLAIAAGIVAIMISYPMLDNQKSNPLPTAKINGELELFISESFSEIWNEEESEYAAYFPEEN